MTIRNPNVTFLAALTLVLLVVLWLVSPTRPYLRVAILLACFVLGTLLVRWTS